MTDAICFGVPVVLSDDGNWANTQFLKFPQHFDKVFLFDSSFPLDGCERFAAVRFFHDPAQLFLGLFPKARSIDDFQSLRKCDKPRVFWQMQAGQEFIQLGILFFMQFQKLLVPIGFVT